MAAKHGFEADHIYQYALKGYSAVIPNSAVEKIMSDPRVKYLEPDTIHYAIGKRSPDPSEENTMQEVVPTGVKLIGAYPCEPWSSGC